MTTLIKNNDKLEHDELEHVRGKKQPRESYL